MVLRYGSVIKCILSMHKALSSIPNDKRDRSEGKKKEEEEKEEL